MALQKAVRQNSGYDATYWRLSNIQIDYDTRRAHLILKGYKDETARRNSPGEAVMDQRRFSVGSEKFEQLFNVPDVSQIPAWDSNRSYTPGTLVTDGDGVWEATAQISPGGTDPSKSDQWRLDSDLRPERVKGYDFIKENSPPFGNASKV